MLIRLWNSKLEQWDAVEVTVPGKPGIGPSDNYVKIRDSFIESDENGNFISSSYTNEELDAVHAFATARLTIDLWEKAIKKNIVWAFKGPLLIRLNEPLIEASYIEDEKAILFGRAGKKQRLTCRAIDIVAHETTHAIIASFWSSNQMNKNLENAAFAESICDVSAMFLKFRLTTHLFNDVNIQFNKTNYYSEFALGYSDTKSMDKGVRSALEFSNVSKRWSTPYTESSHLTHQVYLRFSTVLQKRNKLPKTKVDDMYCEIFRIVSSQNTITTLEKQVVYYLANVE